METYNPKKILITGGAGFIASNVIVDLIKKYPQVKIVNVDKLDYCSSLKNLTEIENCNNYKFYPVDITDFHMIDKIFEIENPDTVMHFAAHTHVDNSFGNSFNFTHNNIYGTHVLLEVSKKYNIKRFIHVSTDEVYGEFDDKIVDEKSTLNPTNPYSASKVGAEFIAKSYYKSFDLPLIITRGNNVYGPKQYPEKLIPKFIIRLNRGLSCPIHGEGLEKRSFIYIDDVVEAFDVILHKGIVGEIYNIGTKEEKTNISVAKELLKFYNFNEFDKIYFVQNRCFNDQRYTLNTDKLNKLGWSPKINFKEGLKKTIEWYTKNKNHWDNIEQALVPHPRLNQ